MEQQTKFDSWHDFVDAEVKSLWKSVHTDDVDYRKTMGTPPEFFRVLQFENADWKQGECKGRVLEARIFTGEHYKDAMLNKAHDFGVQYKAFWQNALFKFCFDANENRVLFEYILAPRFGRAIIYYFQASEAPIRVVRSHDVWIS